MNNGHEVKVREFRFITLSDVIEVVAGVDILPDKSCQLFILMLTYLSEIL